MFNDGRGNGVFAGSWIGQSITLPLTTTTANVQLSPNSVYRVWSSVNCFIQFGNNAVAATTTQSNPLTGGLPEIIVTDLTNFYVAGIVTAPVGSGTLFVTVLGV